MAIVVKPLEEGETQQATATLRVLHSRLFADPAHQANFLLGRPPDHRIRPHELHRMFASACYVATAIHRRKDTAAELLQDLESVRRPTTIAGDAFEVLDPALLPMLDSLPLVLGLALRAENEELQSPPFLLQLLLQCLEIAQRSQAAGWHRSAAVASSYGAASAHRLPAKLKCGRRLAAVKRRRYLRRVLLLARVRHRRPRTRNARLVAALVWRRTVRGWCSGG
mmetsp:Transcript_53674/g.154783  ORF Transcript_53674/g.154783 Transcript_53674/m.154783 type:complete len:224 (+) Transcript_53674:718-1389(+)